MERKPPKRENRPFKTSISARYEIKHKFLSPFASIAALAFTLFPLDGKQLVDVNLKIFIFFYFFLAWNRTCLYFFFVKRKHCSGYRIYTTWKGQKERLNSQENARWHYSAGRLLLRSSNRDVHVPKASAMHPGHVFAMPLDSFVYVCVFIVTHTS